MNTSNNQQLLVICAEPETYEQIRRVAAKAGVGCVYCRKSDEARSILAKGDIDVVFCQDTLPDGDFRAVIAAAADAVPVIVLSHFAEWDYYLAALRDGAFDYIACPPNAKETENILLAAIRKGRELRRGANVLAESAMAAAS
jgi:DNA-binding NtrC family response regulator